MKAVIIEKLQLQVSVDDISLKSEWDPQKDSAMVLPSTSDTLVDVEVLKTQTIMSEISECKA